MIPTIVSTIKPVKTTYIKKVSLLCLIIFPTLCFQAWAGADGAGGINIKAGIILCSESGKILLSQNASTKFIPASTLKVLTSLSALHYLGRDYHFTTDFFLDSDKNLKIKGHGDPLFTSELIYQLCRQLKEILSSMNISEINAIIIDNTFFSPDIKIDGTEYSNNPYDAFIGPLCANFNTVSFRYSNQQNQYISAEPQTPLLPFVLKRVKSSGVKQGRIILSQQESRTYAGMLIEHYLSQIGIRNRGSVVNGVVKNQDRHIYTYRSPYDMDQIIMKLLKYSSNFMANQLFLSAGAKAFSPPATVEKGVEAMKSYAHNLLGISGAQFAEGSGLSRENRISPASMVKVLRRFQPAYKLMQNESMPDGGSEYYKTGTLNGVRTRCGYFETSKGKLYFFVIMVNEDGAGYEKIRKLLWKKVSDQEMRDNRQS